MCATNRKNLSFYINQVLREAIKYLEYRYGILQKVEGFRVGKFETATFDEPVTFDEPEESLGPED